MNKRRIIKNGTRCVVCGELCTSRKIISNSSNKEVATLNLCNRHLKKMCMELLDDLNEEKEGR